MSVRKSLALVVAAVVGWSGAVATAAPVVPLLRGVYDPGDGGPLKALWGYNNPNPSTMFISVGAQNFFSPGPANRGQPTMFMAGAVYGAFVTDLDGSPLTWTLNGTSVTSSGALSLPVDPSVLQPGELVPFVTGVWEYGPNDYAAVFGYANGADTSLNVSLGSTNFVMPLPSFRGQPVTFEPGIVAQAFVVHFTPGSSVSWTLGTDENPVTATADVNSPRLGTDPLPEPASMGLMAAAVAGGLVRRRRTRAAA